MIDARNQFIILKRKSLRGSSSSSLNRTALALAIDLKCSQQHGDQFSLDELMTPVALVWSLTFRAQNPRTARCRRPLRKQGNT